MISDIFGYPIKQRWILDFKILRNETERINKNSSTVVKTDLSDPNTGRTIGSACKTRDQARMQSLKATRIYI
jgi:hypothetical protein